MTRVDFYILAQADPALREQFACRIAEKAYTQGLRVFLLTADEEQSSRLDRLLWTFRQGSFIPHAVAEQREDEPVAVGTRADGKDNVLINLTDNTPRGWGDYVRLAEILEQSEATLQAGRRRYKEYQRYDCPLNTHHIEGRKQ